MFTFSCNNTALRRSELMDRHGNPLTSS